MLAWTPGGTIDETARRAAGGGWGYLAGALVGAALVWYPWLTSPRPYLATLDLRLWLGSAFAAAFLLRLLSAVHPVALPLVMAGGALAAQGVVILVDVQRDPTAHNLFPLELGGAALVTALGASAGVGVAVIGVAVLRRFPRV